MWLIEIEQIICKNLILFDVGTCYGFLPTSRWSQARKRSFWNCRNVSNMSGTLLACWEEHAVACLSVLFICLSVLLICLSVLYICRPLLYIRLFRSPSFFVRSLVQISFFFRLVTLFNAWKQFWFWTIWMCDSNPKIKIFEHLIFHKLILTNWYQGFWVFASSSAKLSKPKRTVLCKYVCIVY